MRHSISILILLLLIILPGCKKVQSKHESISNSEVIIDSTSNNYRRYQVEAIHIIEEYLSDSTKNLLKGKVLIQNKEQLTHIAEPILFNIYGEKKITHEKPYNIFLIGEYWIMFGSLPDGMKGGTFNIAINRRTCEVVGISHGK